MLDRTDKPGHSLRSLIFFALKQMPDETLFKLLYDKDEIVVVMAAHQLHHRPASSDQTFHEAVKFARSTRYKHRELSAYILGQLCPPKHPYKDQSIGILEELITDSNTSVRSEAVAALGHLKSNNSRELVRKYLDDQSEDVVQSSVFFLWKIGFTDDDRKKLEEIQDKRGERTRNLIKYYLADETPQGTLGSDAD